MTAQLKQETGGTTFVFLKTHVLKMPMTITHDYNAHDYAVYSADSAEAQRGGQIFILVEKGLRIPCLFGLVGGYRSGDSSGLSRWSGSICTLMTEGRL